MKTTLILISVIAATLLFSSNQQIHKNVIPAGSKYSTTLVLDGDLPSNDGFCRVTFDLADSLKAEKAFKQLEDIGWHLTFVTNENRNKLALYPLTGAAFGAVGKVGFVDGKPCSIYEGYFNYWFDGKQSLDSILVEKERQINSFAMGHNFKEYTIISVMNFPGEKNLYQVKFSAMLEKD